MKLTNNGQEALYLGPAKDGEALVVKMREEGTKLRLQAIKSLDGRQRITCDAKREAKRYLQHPGGISLHAATEIERVYGVTTV